MWLCEGSEPLHRTPHLRTHFNFFSFTIFTITREDLLCSLLSNLPYEDLRHLTTIQRNVRDPSLDHFVTIHLKLTRPINLVSQQCVGISGENASEINLVFFKFTHLEKTALHTVYNTESMYLKLYGIRVIHCKVIGVILHDDVPSAKFHAYR